MKVGRRTQRWALLLIFVGAVARGGNGAKFSNPLSQPMVPLFISDDANIPFGQCSGTIVNDVPQIVTAAHCFLANRRFARPDEVRVGLFGKRVVPTKIAIHPLYEKLRNLEWEMIQKGGPIHLDLDADRYDLAVITLPANTTVPVPVPLAPTDALLEEQPVVEAEWGFVWPPGDYDGDRVENNRDICFDGVREKKIDRARQEKILRTGPKAGCEKDGKDFTFRDWGWDLRFGPNRIATLEEKALVATERKLPEGVHNEDEWGKWNAKVTPGANGSGGSLFDYWGSLIGVVKGSKLVKKPDGWYIQGLFVDLTAEPNAKFLKDVLIRATYRKEYDDKTNYKFPLYPFERFNLEAEGI